MSKTKHLKPSANTLINRKARAHRNELRHRSEDQLFKAEKNSYKRTAEKNGF